MARKRKMPKRPKRSSSLEVWENYHRRCAEVKKINAKMESDKKRKEALINKRPY